MEATTLWILILCSSLVFLGVVLGLVSRCITKGADTDILSPEMPGAFMAIVGLVVAAIYVCANGAILNKRLEVQADSARHQVDVKK